jgi:hypothetical protein
MKSVSWVKSAAWWQYQTVRNSGKRIVSSLDRQLKVFKAIGGSSIECSAVEQAQDDKKDNFFREVPHGSDLPKSGRYVIKSIT